MFPAFVAYMPCIATRVMASGECGRLATRDAGSDAGAFLPWACRASSTWSLRSARRSFAAAAAARCPRAAASAAACSASPPRGRLAPSSGERDDVFRPLRLLLDPPRVVRRRPLAGLQAHHFARRLGRQVFRVDLVGVAELRLAHRAFHRVPSRRRGGVGVARMRHATRFASEGNTCSASRLGIVPRVRPSLRPAKASFGVLRARAAWRHRPEA